MRSIRTPLQANLDTMILHAINQKPTTAWKFYKQFTEKFGLLISPGTIWPHFNKMETLGIIARKSNGFTLTVKGKAMLKQHNAQLQLLTQFLKEA